MTAEQIIAALQLQRHPEGGWYRETFRATPTTSGRGASTAIYYLLQAGEASHWHKVDADEIWHFYAGDPLQLSLSDDGKAIRRQVLGTDLVQGQAPQLVVPAGVWQSARPLGAFTLVGCTVAPAFDFAGFELAPPGWQPG
ncbi:MAG: cupin domain-containing protein [Rhodospirillales bacterium]